MLCHMGVYCIWNMEVNLAARRPSHRSNRFYLIESKYWLTLLWAISCWIYKVNIRQAIQL